MPYSPRAFPPYSPRAFPSYSPRAFPSLARALALAIALAGTVACGDDSTGPSPITGSYSLRTANGEALPTIVLTSSSGNFDLRSGTLLLNPDNTFVQVLFFTYYGAETEDFSFGDRGTFSRSGNEITFQSDEFGFTFVGLISGETVLTTYPLGGASAALSFRK